MTEKQSKAPAKSAEKPAENPQNKPVEKTESIPITPENMTTVFQPEVHMTEIRCAHMTTRKVIDKETGKPFFVRRVCNRLLLRVEYGRGVVACSDRRCRKKTSFVVVRQDENV